ncbi:MAG: lipopolysaccharide heptosyltransferase II [Gemmataceae bacterium]
MKLAIFLPNWIGDVVMATPAVRALREKFVDARYIGVMRSYVASVVEGSTWFDDTIFLDPHGPWHHRWWAVSRQLRQQNVDLAVLFPNSFRSALVAWLGGCRQRLGYARNGRTWLLTDRLYSLRDAHGRFLPTPVIEDYNRLAAYAGCPQPTYRMELFTTPRDEELAHALWQRWRLDRFPEIVCLNPGAAFGSAKYWPSEYFAILAQELVDRRGSGVLLLCGPSERDMVRQIARLANRPDVFTLADEPVSIGLTKACVRRCDLLITTDSGPRHFAAAFNRPVITLFGPTHIAWTETYHPKAIHLQKKVHCGPCQLRVCPLDHRCMQWLKPAAVFSAVTDLMSRFPPQTFAQRTKAS